MTGAGGERGARVVEKAPSLTLSLKAEQAHGEGATPLDQRSTEGRGKGHLGRSR